MNRTGEAYWNERYQNDNTPWDIGYAATPLMDYCNQLENKDLKILIPGCGNGYEAIELLKNGFKNTQIIDIAPLAIENLKSKVPTKFHDQIILGDFFEHQLKYDLIIEQTFFCALNPSQRTDYAIKMKQLLGPNGKLMGVLFNDALNQDHPPYGGNEREYRSIFEPHFEIEVMETAYNSIGPRAGRELFILMRKKAS